MYSGLLRPATRRTDHVLPRVASNRGSWTLRRSFLGMLTSSTLVSVDRTLFSAEYRSIFNLDMALCMVFLLQRDCAHVHGGVSLSPSTA